MSSNELKIFQSMYWVCDAKNTWDFGPECDVPEAPQCGVAWLVYTNKHTPPRFTARNPFFFSHDKRITIWLRVTNRSSHAWITLHTLTTLSSRWNLVFFPSPSQRRVRKWWFFLPTTRTSWCFLAVISIFLPFSRAVIDWLIDQMGSAVIDWLSDWLIDTRSLCRSTVWWRKQRTFAGAFR